MFQHFSAIFREVFDKAKHNIDYLCHTIAVVELKNRSYNYIEIIKKYVADCIKEYTCMQSAL